MISPLTFFSQLLWIDGRPLLDTIEPYRRRLFSDAFSRDERERLRYSLVLSGRGKKNHKSADAVLAALYVLFAWPESPQGADVYLVAQDLDQADQDLDLCKKLVSRNDVLGEALVVRSNVIERADGQGSIEILPGKDVKGSHGKTYALVVFDELHAAKDYALLEALAPDPTRESLTWICSYDSLLHVNGHPLWDLFQRGKAGTDPRMLFSWYSATYTTDPEFQAETLTPERRANPSMGSWPNAEEYLASQRLRLPSARFRRLHLNLGGSPEGAALSAEKIAACVVVGRRQLPPDSKIKYAAFVDMSGGSSDDAVCAIGYRDEKSGRRVLAAIENQGQKAPFDPQIAVKKFARTMRLYGVTRAQADAYAGNTFRSAFAAEGIVLAPSDGTASDLYESLEPVLNAGDVELLDNETLIEQLSGLVWRGRKIDHLPGEHDDHANAVAGLVAGLARTQRRGASMWHPLTGQRIDPQQFRSGLEDLF